MIIPCILHDQFQIEFRCKPDCVLNVGNGGGIDGYERHSSLEAKVGGGIHISEGIALLNHGRIDDGFPIDKLQGVGVAGAECSIVPVGLDGVTCSRVESWISAEADVRNRPWMDQRMR